MIIARAPFRISFFGGGTDYPAWYREEGGAVISTSIDKYCYITCRSFPPFFPNTFRIVWSHIEPVSSIREILHPSVREGLKMMGFADHEGVEIHHQGDLPARSGMGSSSAFANALLLALSALRGETLSRYDLFHKAIDLEQNWIGETVGSQDQVATAVGGMNVVRFGTDGAIKVEPVAVSRGRLEELQSRLMLFYSGGHRSASDIASSFVSNLSDRRVELKRMEQMVFEGRDILMGNGDLDAWGEMLAEGWMRKRSLGGQISNTRIDSIYERACEAGALGGKLLGAGGAGFILLYVPKDRQAKVEAALDSLLRVNFCFEDGGAQILLKTPEIVV